MKLYVCVAGQGSVRVRDSESCVEERSLTGAMNQICALRDLVDKNDLFMQQVQSRGSRMTDLINAETDNPDPMSVTRGLRLDDGRVFDLETGCVVDRDFVRTSYHLRASVLTTPFAEARGQLATLIRGPQRVLILCDTANVHAWRALALDGRRRSAEVSVVRSARTGDADTRVQIVTWTAMRTGFTLSQYDYGYDRVFLADPLCAPSKMAYNVRANRWTWVVSDSIDVDKCPTHASLVLRLLHVHDDSPQLLSQVQRLTVGVLSTPRLAPVRPHMVAPEQAIPSFLDLCERTIVGENVRTVSADDMDGIHESQRANVRTALFETNPPDACSICLSEPVDTATSCGHLFCRSCIGRVTGPCPMCRAPCFEMFSTTVTEPSKIRWLKASLTPGVRNLVLVYPSFLPPVRKSLEDTVPKTELCQLCGTSRVRAGRLLADGKAFTIVASMLERADVDLSRVERVFMLHTGTPNEVTRWCSRLPPSARVVMGVASGGGDQLRLDELGPLAGPSVVFS